MTLTTTNSPDTKRKWTKEVFASIIQFYRYFFKINYMKTVETYFERFMAISGPQRISAKGKFR